jgi:hypothetical protein
MRYWPKQGLLDVWHGEKVLVIERWDGKPLVAHYKAGIWERDLEEEVAAAKGRRQVPHPAAVRRP